MKSPFTKALTVCMVLLAAMVLPGEVYAQSAGQSVLVLQGRLTDSTGRPLDGTFDVTFRIFSTDTGGAALFTEVHSGGNQIVASKGVFTVQLGSLTTNGLDAAIFDGSERFLEIEVESDGAMAPRTPLGAAPFALNALRLNGRVDTDFALANHTVDSHSDTTATGAELETLTGGAATDAQTLHTHGNLSALTHTHDGTSIDDGTVAAVDLATDSVDTTKIQDGQVGNADLGTDSVDTTKIQDGQVGNADLATNSVDTTKIQDGQVGNADLATNSVDTTKIQDGQVGTADLFDGGVGNVDLSTDSVDTTKIIDATILNADVDAAAGIVVTKLSGTAAVVGSGTLLQLQNTGGDAARNEVLVIRRGVGELLPVLSFVDDANTGTVPIFDFDTVAILTSSDGVIDDANAHHVHTVANANLAGDSVNAANIVDGTITTADVGVDQITSDLILDGQVGSADLKDGDVALADLATDSVDATKITTGAVTADEILDGAITTADIGVDQVTSDLILDGQVGSPDLKDGDVALVDLATDSVDATKISTGAVTADEILDGTITTADLGLDQITSDLILDGQVGSAEITDGSVGTADLDSNIIFSANIKNGEVKTNDLDNDAVTTGKIADGAILTQDIAVAQITSDLIQDGQVTLADLQADSVDSTKIVALSVAGGDLAGDSVDTTKIVNATILTQDIAVAQITSDLIQDGQVTLADLQADSVDSTKIVALSVAGGDLAGDSVDTTKIVNQTILTQDIAVAQITSDLIQDGQVTLADMQADSVDTTKIVDGTILATDIAAEAITSDRILNEAGVDFATLSPGTFNPPIGGVAINNTNELLQVDLDAPSAGFLIVTVSGTAVLNEPLAHVEVGFDNVADPVAFQTSHELQRPNDGLAGDPWRLSFSVTKAIVATAGVNSVSAIAVDVVGDNLIEDGELTVIFVPTQR